jgi:hypothetical protein
LTEEEQRFVDGMKRVYPRIMKMEEPLTYKQYSDVVAQYGEAITKEKLEAMQNSKQLLGKNSSAVLTLRNWIRRELK